MGQRASMGKEIILKMYELFLLLCVIVIPVKIDLVVINTQYK